MLKNLLLILTFVSIVSCTSNKNDDIYKTSSGEFASKIGNFISDFPSKPTYTVIDNQIGLDKFQLHLYRSTLGPHRIFNIEYTDYPEYIIKSMSNEQLYIQGVTNYANKMGESFYLEYQDPIEQNGLNGQAFKLKINDYSLAKNKDVFILGRLFRDGNRVYTITYIGVNDENVGSFVNSFRLLE